MGHGTWNTQTLTLTLTLIEGQHRRDVEQVDVEQVDVTHDETRETNNDVANAQHVLGQHSNASVVHTPGSSRPSVASNHTFTKMMSRMKVRKGIHESGA